MSGTNAADAIAIDSTSGSTLVTVNGTTTTYADSDISGLDIRAGDGDDVVTLTSNVIVGASIAGEGGNDTLTGGAGDDTLDGGLGDDELDGGGGTNTADYSSRTESIVVDQKTVKIGSETDLLDSNLQRFISGSGDDNLQIFSGSDGDPAYVDAGPGNDTVDLTVLYNSDATVHGGAGDDSILIYDTGKTGFYFGDDGNDTFRVFRSSFTARDFNGGSGTDSVDYSGFGSAVWAVDVTLDNVANDGAAAEYVSQVAKDNVHDDIEIIVGTDGADTLVGNSGNQTLDGGGGDDVIDGGGGQDSIDGGDGDNTIVNPVGGGRTSLIDNVLRVVGTADADEVTITKNDDQASLNVSVNGQDATYLIGDMRLIIIYGREGNDVLQFAPNNGGVKIATKIYGDQGADTILGSATRDRVYGGDDADSINGGSGNDIIYGEGGDDTIFGAVGNDYLVGGAGADSIQGNRGRDRIFRTDNDSVLSDEQDILEQDVE